TRSEPQPRARDPRSVAPPPLCAIEQHGPHLRLLVDWLGAEDLARRIAPHLSRAGYRPILAPALPYGVSTLAVSWGGTVSLSTRSRASSWRSSRRSPTTVPQLRPRELSGGSRPSPRDGRRAPGAPSSAWDPRGGCGIRARCEASERDAERSRARAHAKPSACSRVALGRAGDVADAGASAEARAPRRRPPP